MRKATRRMVAEAAIAQAATSWISVVILSEDIYWLATLRQLLQKGKGSFQIHLVTDPHYLVSTVSRYRPEVVVLDLQLRRLGQDCWPILEAAKRVVAQIQFVVIDNESEPGEKLETAHGLITIPRALASQPGVLAQHVRQAGEQAAADRAACRRR